MQMNEFRRHFLCIALSGNFRSFVMHLFFLQNTIFKMCGIFSSLHLPEINDKFLFLAKNRSEDSISPAVRSRTSARLPSGRFMAQVWIRCRMCAFWSLKRMAANQAHDQTHNARMQIEMA